MRNDSKMLVAKKYELSKNNQLSVWCDSRSHDSIKCFLRLISKIFMDEISFNFVAIEFQNFGP